uniref:Uncharacterized protein n=1 Tax=Pyxicephalus adspersus TaxID=30357 RepID=A0AAV3B9C3_PYXAD|nr:TPA: hypothetical protein GDO54_007827 [Pyxicephalus adspersus]
MFENIIVLPRPFYVPPTTPRCFWMGTESWVTKQNLPLAFSFFPPSLKKKFGGECWAMYCKEQLDVLYVVCRILDTSEITTSIRTL